jgi:hypothetical protein
VSDIKKRIILDTKWLMNLEVKTNRWHGMIFL